MCSRQTNRLDLIRGFLFCFLPGSDATRSGNLSDEEEFPRRLGAQVVVRAVRENGGALAYASQVHCPELYLCTDLVQDL